MCKSVNSEIRTPKDLIDFLQDDGRLEKPRFSPNSIADLMARCWQTEPNSRPTFSLLEKELGKILEGSVRQQYLKLDDEDPHRNKSNNTNKKKE